MSTPILLVLGSGPRIGASIAASFANDGYHVALASRKGTDTRTDEGYLSIRADLATLESIPGVFDAVKTEFGAAPSVVVYNVAVLRVPPDEHDLFCIPVEGVIADVNIMAISSYVAAQEAIRGWMTLPAEMKKTFICTGNCTNTKILPEAMFMTLGMGKAALAYWVGVADKNAPTNCRFFYADERHENGKNKGLDVDGPAHGEFYPYLVKHEGNLPWHVTFVKGKGYVKF
ncbi:hypothetical protein K461DRAFT_319083 [Myriangium duriaei CBS 260.36]|uniref:Short-chain dehydrogenase n=1 Tax=Myriangium duriaei CBS 260.36 TaxID=1168546 RepID=A0A9P4J313_9PEZI|nr:hypothetical protein K461DRAFT_319083 [Myriangium duriaei CBS 260.36]